MVTRPHKSKEDPKDSQAKPEINPERPIKTDRFYKLICETRGRMSERAFAELIGTTNTTLQNLRKGWHEPSVDLQRKVSRYLGWSDDQMSNYIEFGIKPTFDKLDDVLAMVRIMHEPDLVKVLKTTSDRLSEVVSVRFPDKFQD